LCRIIDKNAAPDRQALFSSADDMTRAAGSKVTAKAFHSEMAHFHFLRNELGRSHGFSES
jgi:hypothetical protein